MWILIITNTLAGKLIQEHLLHLRRQPVKWPLGTQLQGDEGPWIFLLPTKDSDQHGTKEPGSFIRSFFYCVSTKYSHIRAQCFSLYIPLMLYVYIYILFDFHIDFGFPNFKITI